MFLRDESYRPIRPRRPRAASEGGDVAFPPVLDQASLAAALNVTGRGRRRDDLGGQAGDTGGEATGLYKARVVALAGGLKFRIGLGLGPMRVTLAVVDARR